MLLLRALEGELQSATGLQWLQASGLVPQKWTKKHQNRCEEVRSKTLHNYFQRDAGSRAPLKTKMKPDEASPKKLLCKIIIQLEVPLLVKRATSRMW